MRMRLYLCIILPVCILALGTGTLLYAHSVSAALEQPLDALNEWCLQERYEDVLTALDSLDMLWEKKRAVLQLFIDHHAIDDVTLELRALRSGALSHSQPDALLASARLRENAQHLFHRDLPVLQNIL